MAWRRLPPSEAIAGARFLRLRFELGEVIADEVLVALGDVVTVESAARAVAVLAVDLVVGRERG
jgi:hypothetical protein